MLLSTGAVLLTFLIGRVLFADRVALLAAGFHAVNGFLVALSSGRRVADHVDTTLIFFVELGIWLALKSRSDPRARDLLLTGVALGLAGLSKSAPALLILPVAFVAFLQRSTLRVALSRSAAIAVVGLILVAPWIVYITSTFPDEARWSGLYTLMHMSQSLEGPPSSPFAYVLELPRFFGELVWIPLVAVIVTAVRGTQPGLRLVLVWVAIPYLTFSMMSTRLPGYVMIAAPAVFLVEAHFCIGLRRSLRQLDRRRHRVAAMVLLVLLVALPVRYLLEPTGSFERRDRDPASSRELRSLSQRLGCLTRSFSTSQHPSRRCSTRPTPPTIGCPRRKRSNRYAHGASPWWSTNRAANPPISHRIGPSSACGPRCRRKRVNRHVAVDPCCVVGAPGFEPGASCSQSRRATRLRHAPTIGPNEILSTS